MTIKSKISFYISIFFTVLFAGTCLFIGVNFSDFRKVEFEERLKEKALTSIKLLIDVKEVDQNLLKIIDQNTINKLYNEKTLIFDKDYKLIYSSLDNTRITWTNDDLKYLKKHKTFFKKEGEYEVFGVFYDTNEKDYFALIMANDNFGKRKLAYLINLLIVAGVLFIVAIWFCTFYVVKKQLWPLDQFHKKIKGINDLNTDERLQSSSSNKNEINLIGSEFNYMMDRIREVYQKQKEFTAHASHEFRTPLARISAQLENHIEEGTEEEKIFLRKIFEDVNQLKGLINSLLILSKVDNKKVIEHTPVRIDEVIYESISKISNQFKDIKIHFTFEEFENMETLLEVRCNFNLLEIAMINLLKNAYLYSNDKNVFIEINQSQGKLILRIINSGTTINEIEQKSLFEPFMRGNSANGRPGLGLGLRIVDRIATVHGIELKYSIENKQNVFTLYF